MAAEGGSGGFLGDLEPLNHDPKATEDYSEAVKNFIQGWDALVRSSDLNSATESLFLLEKQCRQASDGPSGSKLCHHLLKVYMEMKDFDKINEKVVIICKKRGQLKTVVINVVKQVMDWMDSGCDGSDNHQILRLLLTLCTVTEGKIFVEVERARLVRRHAQMMEEEGQIEDATKLLQEVQVETFGAMDKREMAEYILHQMRLVLLKGDFVRLQIISKKINTDMLKKEEFSDLKLQYYTYLIQYQLHESSLMEVRRCCYLMFDTPTVKADTELWKQYLTNYILYLLLSQSDDEQKKCLENLVSDDKFYLKQLPTFRRLVYDFMTLEITPWPLSYGNEIRLHPVFQDSPNVGGESRWTLLRKRIQQHNINVIGVYYTRITLDRISSLLSISKEEAEEEISELVTSKSLCAKIDRPDGIVYFGKRKVATDRMDDWTADISKLLDLLDESSHLIQKERMINAARLKRAQMDARHTSTT